MKKYNSYDYFLCQNNLSYSGPSLLSPQISFHRKCRTTIRAADSIPNMVMSGKMATKTDESGTLATETQRNDDDSVDAMSLPSPDEVFSGKITYLII